MLVLQGKCTENCLLSFDVAYFLPMFYDNGGMLGINVYRINKLLSLKSIPVYGSAVHLGQKCMNKL